MREKALKPSKRLTGRHNVLKISSLIYKISYKLYKISYKLYEISYKVY